MHILGEYLRCVHTMRYFCGEHTWNAMILDSTQNDTGMGVVGYKANRTQKRVGSFPFKIRQSNSETVAPRPQTRVVLGKKWLFLAQSGRFGRAPPDLARTP